MGCNSLAPRRACRDPLPNLPKPSFRSAVLLMGPAQPRAHSLSVVTQGQRGWRKGEGGKGKCEDEEEEVGLGERAERMGPIEASARRKAHGFPLFLTALIAS